jgi:hypothetical protein
MPSNLANLLRGLIVLAFYAFAGWRIVKTNRGNRVIECGIVAIILLFALGLLAKLGAPDWLMGSLGLLLLLVCLLTVGLYIRKAYLAVRQRLWKSY